MSVRDLAFADIPTLGQALAAGAIAAGELTQFYLDRLNRIGRALNAVVTLDPAGARAAAQASDLRRASGAALGPLDGIPFAVKDNIFTASPLPTLLGVSSLATPLPSVDADVVRRLKQAGAVLLGKLALMELLAMLPFDRFDASATGVCRNPYDPDAWTGDSSTGPAAAVAAGLVPFALATETHGSIVQPAAFCGAVGLRPTHGAVSLEGAFVVSPSVDRIGPIARTPADALTVLQVIGVAAGCPAAPTRPRVGVLHPLDTADAEVRSNFRTLVERLTPIAELTETELPDLSVADCFRTIVTHEARIRYAPLIADGTVAALVSPEARDGSYLAPRSDPVALADALRVRNEIEREVVAWFEPFDVVLAVTNPRVAPPIVSTFSEWFGDNDHEAITTVGALLGLPAVSIPCGLGAQMRPIGVQFVGRRGSDAMLVDIARRAAAKMPLLAPPDLDAFIGQGRDIRPGPQ